MKKIMLFFALSVYLSSVCMGQAQAEEAIVHWSGTFINKETGMMMHNNSVRINNMGIGFFPTGFYKEENSFICKGTVALGEDLQARVSNFMFYKYVISEDEDVIIVSRDERIPVEDTLACTEILYGIYERMP